MIRILATALLIQQLLATVQHHVDGVKGPHLSRAAVRGAAVCMSCKLAVQATWIRERNGAGLLQGHERQGSKKEMPGAATGAGASHTW